jgi:hypothetical protein
MFLCWAQLDIRQRYIGGGGLHSLNPLQDDVARRHFTNS